jgi:acetyl esterase/lipase
VVVGWHGGGWQVGSPVRLVPWGEWLAANGYAAFLPDYTLSAPGRPSYPALLEDARAALAFVGAEAAALGLDPARVAVLGESSGAHLAALAALVPPDPAPAGLPTVRALIGVYGIYDLIAQWQYDLVPRPLNSIVELLMGYPPMQDRLGYLRASPLSYATLRDSAPSCLLVWGDRDDVVDPATQSEPFLLALKQARFLVRNLVIPGAGHYWLADPVEEPGGYGRRLAPRLLRFLQERLRAPGQGPVA